MLNRLLSKPWFELKCNALILIYIFVIAGNNTHALHVSETFAEKHDIQKVICLVYFVLPTQFVKKILN
jgi:hypothetical protein